MSQRIPDLVRPALQDYLSLVNGQLPRLLNAFYLEGSIALGGFNEYFSDIDFIACFDRQPSPAEIDALHNIHQGLKDRHSQWELQGSYVLFDDLSCWGNEAGSTLTFHDGKLRPGGEFGPQSVEGWIMKNHGIAIVGPEPRDLPFTIDWDLLILKMRENLNTYWAGWAKRPDRFLVMLSDWGIQWAILGALRQFYSFQQNSITTKAKAGEYALTCVPACWHRLIHEAIDIREGKTISVYRFRAMRAVEAVRFLKFIIRTCNANTVGFSHYA